MKVEREIVEFWTELGIKMVDMAQRFLKMLCRYFVPFRLKRSKPANATKKNSSSSKKETRGD